MADDQITKDQTVDDLQEVLYEGYRILERACLITDGAPYFMSASQEFAVIVIDGAEATLSWPEVHSGYYDGCDLETQSVEFPSALLLMSETEIGKWKEQETAKYEAAQKAKREDEDRRREEACRRAELAMLAELKAKYG